MTRSAVVGWNALGLTLLLGVSAQDVRAEELVATRTVESETTGSVTHGDDGAKTRESTKTYTNAKGEQVTVEKSRTTTHTESGRSRTVESSTTATPTENGKTWTHDRTIENSVGGSRTSHTEAQTTRNGDGTVSSSSHTDRSGTTARGKAWSGSADRSATREKSDGSVKTKRSVSRTGGPSRARRR